jgi:hypothetical protein
MSESHLTTVIHTDTVTTLDTGITRTISHTGFDWEDTPIICKFVLPYALLQRTGYSVQLTIGFTGPLAPILMHYHQVDTMFVWITHHSYSNSPGRSEMFHSMPIVDVSGSNITGLYRCMSMYCTTVQTTTKTVWNSIVRSGDDPSDLGCLRA